MARLRVGVEVRVRVRVRVKVRGVGCDDHQTTSHAVEASESEGERMTKQASHEKGVRAWREQVS